MGQMIALMWACVRNVLRHTLKIAHKRTSMIMDIKDEDKLFEALAVIGSIIMAGAIVLLSQIGG